MLVILHVNRWRYLHHIKDERKIWKAIDWKGQVNNKSENIPSDSEFVTHFKSLLYNEHVDHPTVNMTSYMDIPPDSVFDQPFSEPEVDYAMEIMKESTGPDGIPSRILKYLPYFWFCYLIYILNFIFLTIAQPSSWCDNTLVAIFKKGAANICSNYRDINVINSFAKVYDYLIMNRLKNWKLPSREQAGGLKNRNCEEHIVTLRLMSSYANKKKLKLYILFIDYSSAYASIPRVELINYLKSIGCPRLLLLAISSAYKSTYIIFKSVKFLYNLGVRAGAPSSGYLFILFMDKFVSMLKAYCPDSGPFKWLHTLLYMDDKIIIGYDISEMQHKCNILSQFCEYTGMKVNKDKTRLMVINPSPDTDDNIYIDNWLVPICEKYCYLGCMFSSDGNMNSAMKLQSEKKQKQLFKFSIFLSKNINFPYFIKKKVLEAALFSSILFGCESWLCNNFASMNTIYINSIKLLLGIRHSIPEDIVLIESGFKPLKQIVREKQLQFYRNKVLPRLDMLNDPLAMVFKVVERDCPSLINFFKQDTVPHFDTLDNIKNTVINSDRSRSMKYIQINPMLTVHNIYLHQHFVPEYHRIAFTRMRVSSHYLRVETGRWSVPPLPISNRVCQCGFLTQDEAHVIQHCSISESIRAANPDIHFNFDNLFNHEDYGRISGIIHRILKLYET